MGWFLFPALALLVVLVLASATAVRWKAAALCVLALALSSWWLIDQLSGDGINAAVVYHMESNMEGAGIGDFKGVIAAFLALAALSLCALLLPRVRRFRLQRHGGAVLAAFGAVLVATVAASPLTRDALRMVHRMQPVDYRQVASQYVVPAPDIRHPRNIVWIYGESLERTYLDQKAFPGLMPHMAQLVRQGLDVRDLGQVEGTGWTIAGMVASQCGVPLTTAPGDENSMGRMDRFLPEAQCLGDVLKRHGYALHFTGGADAAFAGKGLFLKTHGYDDVRDTGWFRAQGVGPEHFSEWGVHDDVLLDDAWASFQSLSQRSRADGKPFMLAALTMDTHNPAGHIPLSCRGQAYTGRGNDQPLLDAIHCSDRLVGQLVDRIRNSPYDDDTLIVVSSDHLAMPNDLSGVLAGLHRENLLLYLGKGIAPRELTASRSSTLDSGATLLQLLDPSSEAIGFGRSMLEPQPATTASAVARAGDERRYPRYLAYAQSLWLGTGAATHALRLDGDARVAIGSQRMQPPVLLQYDGRGQLASVTLEDGLTRLTRTPDAQSLAYVQRCAAFEDAALDGEWCALLYDPQRGARIVGDAQLRQGVRVDAAVGRPARYGTQARIPVTVANRIDRPDAGDYVLRLWTGKHPPGPFWVEAVTADGRVLATQWVQPDKAGRVQLPLALAEPEDVVRLRAWVDSGQHFTVGRHTLTPVRMVASNHRQIPALPPPVVPAGSDSRVARSRG